MLYCLYIYESLVNSHVRVSERSLDMKFMTITMAIRLTEQELNFQKEILQVLSVINKYTCVVCSSLEGKSYLEFHLGGLVVGG